MKHVADWRTFPDCQCANPGRYNLEPWSGKISPAFFKIRKYKSQNLNKGIYFT
jgi:hypothetical protein